MSTPKLEETPDFSENLNSNFRCWFRPVISTFDQHIGELTSPRWIRVLKVHACGCSLAMGKADISVIFPLEWFRTSACHVDDPGSNPGNRTIYFSCHPLAECRRRFHVPKNKILKKRNRDGYGRFVLLFLFLIRISPATTATTTTITMIM